MGVGVRCAAGVVVGVEVADGGMCGVRGWVRAH